MRKHVATVDAKTRGLHEGKHQVAQLEINHPTREEVLDCLTSTGKALNTISGLHIDYKAVKVYFCATAWHRNNAKPRGK